MTLKSLIIKTFESVTQTREFRITSTFDRTRVTVNTNMTLLSFKVTTSLPDIHIFARFHTTWKKELKFTAPHCTNSYDTKEGGESWRTTRYCRKCGGIFCGSCSEVGALVEWPALRVCRLCRTHRWPSGTPVPATTATAAHAPVNAVQWANRRCMCAVSVARVGPSGDHAPTAGALLRCPANAVQWCRLAPALSSSERRPPPVSALLVGDSIVYSVVRNRTELSRGISEASLRCSTRYRIGVLDYDINYY